MQEVSGLGMAAMAFLGAGAGYGVNHAALYFLGRYRQEAWQYGGLFRVGRGRAAPIRVDMAAVEVMAALLSVVALLRCGDAVTLGLTLPILYLILLLGLIDLRIKTLPNLLTFGGVPLGLLLAACDPTRSLPGAFGGMAVGAGFAAVTAWIYFRLRGQEGLGMGDLKLLAFFGTFAGPDGILGIIALGSVAAALYGLIAAHLQGQEDPGAYELPFGPFLGAAALLLLL